MPPPCPFHRERVRQRQRVLAIVAVSRQCPAECVDGVVEATRLHGALTPLEPLRGITEIRMAIRDGHGTGRDERRDGCSDQDPELHDLPLEDHHSGCLGFRADVSTWNSGAIAATTIASQFVCVQSIT